MTELNAFHFTRWPEIHYGSGVVKGIQSSLPTDPDLTLWVTGGSSEKYSLYFDRFLAVTELQIPKSRIVHISGEPSPELIDEIVGHFRNESIRQVVGVGGGSVVDAAKAISVLLAAGTSIFDHLEGVGRGIPLTGEKLPFSAVPTTSGTGSEMTANAVFSHVGESGYKKSIRHKNLVPDEIWIDPDLLTTCPPMQTVCSGMDAFTQLLEPYLSTKANVITDTLAEKGLQLIVDNLEAAHGEGNQNPDVRGSIALAAAFSGTCLANAGLGIVHGLAGPIGGYFDIPHGVVCAGLLAKANEVNHRALQERGEAHYLQKMAKVGKIFGQQADSTEDYCQLLTDNLYRWERTFQLPKFSEYGIQIKDIPKIVSAAGNRNNPVALTEDEIGRILEHCI